MRATEITDETPPRGDGTTTSIRSRHGHAARAASTGHNRTAYTREGYHRTRRIDLRPSALLRAPQSRHSDRPRRCTQPPSPRTHAQGCAVAACTCTTCACCTCCLQHVVHFTCACAAP